MNTLLYNQDLSPAQTALLEYAHELSQHYRSAGWCAGWGETLRRLMHDGGSELAQEHRERLVALAAAADGWVEDPADGEESDNPNFTGKFVTRNGRPDDTKPPLTDEERAARDFTIDATRELLDETRKGARMEGFSRSRVVALLSALDEAQEQLVKVTAERDEHKEEIAIGAPHAMMAEAEWAETVKRAEVAEMALAVFRDHARTHGYAALADASAADLAASREKKIYAEGEAQGFRNARQQWIDSSERLAQCPSEGDHVFAVAMSSPTAVVRWCSNCGTLKMSSTGTDFVQWRRPRHAHSALAEAALAPKEPYYAPEILEEAARSGHTPAEVQADFMAWRRDKIARHTKP